jgi:hypothetical protein
MVVLKEIACLVTKIKSTHCCTVLDRELNQELPTVATSAAPVVDGLTK